MSVLHISALICSKYYLDTMLEKIGVGRGGGHISSELEDVLYFTKINSNLDIQNVHLMMEFLLFLILYLKLFTFE